MKNNKRPKVYYVKFVIPPFRGMALPPFGIFIKKQFRGNKKILKHDLIHWQQYRRMGFFMYYLRYLLQLIIIGYDTMPMEMEARRGEKENDRWNYRNKYHN